MLKLILFLSGLSLAASTHHSYFYRKDYTFIMEFDAHYKVHWNKDGVSLDTALTICDDEGATLFFPNKTGEWSIVKNLTSMLAEVSDTGDVIVGFYVGSGFETVEAGVTPSPILKNQIIHSGKNCIIMDMETGAYRPEYCDETVSINKIFVCKKVDEKPCPTIDLGHDCGVFSVYDFRDCWNSKDHLYV